MVMATGASRARSRPLGVLPAWSWQARLGCGGRLARCISTSSTQDIFYLEWLYRDVAPSCAQKDLCLFFTNPPFIC